jgi:serine/threonine protein phosphatase PrpC
MVTCPKCKAENRPEAAFCARCGTILFAQPAPSKLTDRSEETRPPKVMAEPEIPEPVPDIAIEENVIPATQEPAEVIPTGLQPRSEGSIFGDRFRYDAQLTQEEHEIRYTVTETMQADIPPVRICSNAECRTIHCPIGPEVENFCTQCGHPLEENSLLFLLRESDENQFNYINHVLELHLVHPNIHPPVANFQQDTPAGNRYCLVTPYSTDLPSQAEISDVLDWGVQLANSLDYLQAKGIVLGDEFNLSCIGLVENKALWRDFTSVRILPLLTDREKINNLRHLVLAMYSLMTGKIEYTKDPYLPSALSDLFEKALVAEGFTSGADLVQQIELVKSGSVSRLILDYQVGRRSHPGKVRTNNEDSLLSMELSCIYQGTIQPCGLFAIADGMGGHASGELASSIVINTIAQKAPCDIVALQNPRYEEYGEWLKETVRASNQAVYDARQKAGNDMGSTLVLCLLIGTHAYLTSLGDSRIYLVNHESIKQLTIDHSLVQHMVSNGQISEEEARYHPQRNVIYRSLGDKPQVEVECITQQLFPHDRLLLCSDGLSNLLEDQNLKEIILDASSPQVACDRLVEAANLAGGDDNISAILIEVIPV